MSVFFYFLLKVDAGLHGPPGPPWSVWSKITVSESVKFRKICMGGVVKKFTSSTLEVKGLAEKL